MKKSVVVPLVMLASVATLASCTRPGMTPPPAVPAAPQAQVIDNLTPPAPPTPPVDTVAPVAPAAQSTGTTSAVTTTRTVSYDSKTPEGMVDVEFTVTVDNGVITAASSTAKTDKQGSKYNQESFGKDLSAKVVGKTAKNLDVDAIGGASLTTAAFEQFVQSL